MHEYKDPREDKIPAGWRRVQRGAITMADMYWNDQTRNWSPITLGNPLYQTKACDAGFIIRETDRPKTKKAAKPARNKIFHRFNLSVQAAQGNRYCVNMLSRDHFPLGQLFFTHSEAKAFILALSPSETIPEDLNGFSCTFTAAHNPTPRKSPQKV